MYEADLVFSKIGLYYSLKSISFLSFFMDF